MKIAATTAIRRPVVAPTATPAVCELVSGGGLPAAGVWLGVFEGARGATAVLEPSVSAPFVVEASSDPDVDVELGVSVRALEALSDVAETRKPVELAALCMEEVCRVSAVSLSHGTVLVLAPVGSAERLKVIPSSVGLVEVPLRPTDKPIEVDGDGCIGDDQVEFAPAPNFVDDVNVSLAGICEPGTFEDKVADMTLDVRMLVWLTAASVTVVSSENATVLMSIMLDLMLETYTVENVAVTIPGAIDVPGCV